MYFLILGGGGNWTFDTIVGKIMLKAEFHGSAHVRAMT